MSTDIMEMNETAGIPSLEFLETRQTLLINIVGSFLAIIGAVGNFLSFRSAAYLPEATSKYLMRYLAVFDTLTALNTSVIRLVLYNFVIPQLQVNQVTQFHHF